MVSLFRNAKHSRKSIRKGALQTPGIIILSKSFMSIYDKPNNSCYVFLHKYI